MRTSGRRSRAKKKLSELHGLTIARETLRKWLVRADIWLPRAARKALPHQPRNRRECLGELVQIDGCKHHWFEDRGPECTLLVYVDDATSRLMELRFVVSESAFDYFEATRTYLHRYGKPVAFYSDKHSIFRVYHEGATGRSKGVTQFGRALAELNIDIICANSPQAKGRVERMNSTLQDRLVKELRLQGISTMDAGNAFAPAFIEDYNRRFGREPRNPHNAHRTVLPVEDLNRIFTWQDERTLTPNLVVHFKRVSYMVTPSPVSIPLGGKRVRVSEYIDGRVEIRHGETLLPYSIFDKNPVVGRGAVIENKRLGAALSVIQSLQAERDADRLASRSLTLRQKDRLLDARIKAQASAAPTQFNERMATVLESIKQREAEYLEKKREQNRRNQERFRLKRRVALEAASVRSTLARARAEAIVATQAERGDGVAVRSLLRVVANACRLRRACHARPATRHHA